jgi:hypothetical protein
VGSYFPTKLGNYFKMAKENYSVCGFIRGSESRKEYFKDLELIMVPAISILFIKQFWTLNVTMQKGVQIFTNIILEIKSVDKLKNCIIWMKASQFLRKQNLWSNFLKIGGIVF